MKYLKRYNENIEWEFEEEDEEENSNYSDFIGHEDFYEFLVDNDALDGYIKNYNYYNVNSIKIFLDDIINKEKYISDAFDWSETIEGLNYWLLLYDKWVKFLKNK